MKETAPARIVVSRTIPDAALEILQPAGPVWVSPHDRPLTRDELYDATRGTSAFVAMLHDRIDDALLLEAGPSLRVVANVAVGYDNVDVDACRRHGVIATNTPGVLTDATADIALALILITTRRIGEGARIVRAGQPWNWNMSFLLGAGAQGKTLGIVGLGQIGRATASRCRALGMSIVYTGPRRVDPAVEAELEASFRPLPELLETADIVSLHCPLNADTRHLIDASALARMKPTAYLVNTSRGAVIDEAALVDALRDDVIAGAGLDVYENEPAVHPGLIGLDNAVCLPHIGSATIETRTAMAVLAAENVIAVLDGRPPVSPIPGLLMAPFASSPKLG